MGACGVALRQSSWQLLSARDRKILKQAAAHLEFGRQVVYVDGSANDWFVFYDLRVSLKQMAYLGCLWTNIALIPPGYEVPELPEGGTDRDQLQDDVVSFCSGIVVLPKDIVYTEGGNVWQETLDAQSTPGDLRAGYVVPAGWSPKEVP